MNVQEEKNILHIIDDRLIEIAKDIYLQKFITPTNLAQERERFLQNNGKYNPQFTYNLPEEAKILAILEELHTMKQKYFDTTPYTLGIAHLLREKLEETIQKTQLLLAYSRQDFAAIDHYNTLLFWPFSEDLLAKSETILQTYEDPADPKIRGKKLTHEEVTHYIQEYLKDHAISDITLKTPAMSMNTFVITFGTNHCHLIFSQTLQTRQENLHANLLHEIWVHYQRYAQGKQRERKILAYGTANYARDEEWLALYAMCEHKKKFFAGFIKKSIYEKYILLAHSQGKSFEEIGTYIQTHGIATHLKKIFVMVASIKKWIKDTSQKSAGTLFIKHKIYAEWREKINSRLGQWYDISLLYQGKIKIEDLPYLSC